MKPLIATLIAASFVLSCQSNETVDPHKPPTTASLEPYECGSLTRLHTLDNLFLGSQPSADDLAQAKKGGILTVINLRHESEVDYDEPVAAAAQGMSYINLPWNGPDELTDAVFTRGRELLNTAERPALVHCSSGNRVGAIWLAWRTLDSGLSYDDALAEAKVVGVKTPAYIDKARSYINRQR